jgi:transcriptional regulator with XRE-family HTH domain
MLLKETVMSAAHGDGVTIGELIRRYRRMAGLTQEELGEKAELSVRAVRNLEQDKVYRPHRSTVERLALALSLNKKDTAHLMAAARTIGPSSTPVAVQADRADWPPEWSGLQPLLGHLIRRLSLEGVLVIPVFVACGTCGGGRRANQIPTVIPGRLS